MERIRHVRYKLNEYRNRLYNSPDEFEKAVAKMADEALTTIITLEEENDRLRILAEQQEEALKKLQPEEDVKEPEANEEAKNE